MHSLFIRFFLSFWLVIGLIIGAAGVGGFLYAERLQETIEDFAAGDSMVEASTVLENGGRRALANWLRGLPRDDGVLVYVVDENGHELLRRQVPFAMQRMFQRHRSRMQRHDCSTADCDRVRRSRYMPQLIAPDGSTLTMLVTPVRSPALFWTSSDARYLLLVFALIASGLVSYALAAAFSRPVRKLRDATVALADGDLNIRVAEAIGRRRDELGMLGRDFDSMAEKLQKAADQQTELSRNISHELRSPLARIRVAVELARLKAGELSEFQRLDDEAERLDSLIGQILSYTRLETDSSRSFAPVDLADVVNEVAENVNFESKDSRRLTIDQTSGTQATIHGYREALISAIENIVRNAVSHSAADSTIAITLEDDGENVIIAIEDNGSGVDEDDLPRLFEPFFRTRSSVVKNGNGGTGLGLAIARRAIELHHGTIDAKNRDSGGLVFTITLPRAR